MRNYWQIKNIHRVLDISFREDESRIRKEKGALEFNIMRKVAMKLFKKDNTKKPA